MRQKLTRIIFIVICFIGFGLRLYRLDTPPFRGDEAFSVQRWTQSPLSVSLTEIASLEPHPPITYILFRFWGIIFGTQSEFALRMLPVLFNMLGISAIYALGRRLSQQSEIAILAAFLWAIHPFEIWHAQDFRNYGIWAGLSVFTLYSAIRLITTANRSAVDWIFYATIATLASLIFYNELITIGVLSLYVLIVYWRQRDFVFQWSLLNAGIIALIIGTFIVFQGNLLTSGGYSGTTGGFQLSQLWQRFIPVLSFGDTLSVSLLQQFNPHTVWWVIPALALIFSLLYLFTSNIRQSIFLMIVGFAPLIVLSIISTRLSIFRPRYILLVIPAYILIISYAFFLLWQKNHTKPLSLSLFVVWVGLCAVSLSNYYHNPVFSKSPDWRSLVTYLEDNTQVDEAIIQTGVDAGFGYYYERSNISAGEFALPADVTQPIPEVINIMEETTETYHTIWIVGQTFPDWQNAGVVENWAYNNLQLVRETQIAGLPVRQFMSWNVLPSQIQSEPMVTYGNAIQLVGTQLFEPEPTKELTLWLYWQPIEQTESPLTVFVHLVGSTNPETGTPLWSQDDHPPQNGRVTTNMWQLGEVYRDVFMLPLEGVVSGEYNIQVGFYDPMTNERLLTENGADAYTVDSIIIE